MSKRLQGFSIFRVVYEKLSGVFFQRAEGKLEPVSVRWMSKRLQGFSIFRVVYEKLSGVFFQRAEGKLEPDSPFN